MRVTNQTDWKTEHLRAIVVAVAREYVTTAAERRKIANLVVRFQTDNGVNTYFGIARSFGSFTGEIRITTPGVAYSIYGQSIAHVFANALLSWCEWKLNGFTVTPFLKYDTFPIERKPPKPTEHPEPLVRAAAQAIEHVKQLRRRRAKIQQTIKTWKRKQKLAETKLKFWNKALVKFDRRNKELLDSLSEGEQKS